MRSGLRRGLLQLASARGCTNHLSEGRPASRSARPVDCGSRTPAPEKLLRPPAPALQDGGLTPRGRSQLGLGSAGGQPRGERSRAAAGDSALGRCAGGSSRQRGRGLWRRAAPRARRSHNSGSLLVRSPATGPSSAASSPARTGLAATRRRSAWRRTPRPCGAGGRRPAPAGRSAPPGPAPCRASSPGGPATAWPAHCRAGTGRRPRRRPP